MRKGEARRHSDAAGPFHVSQGLWPKTVGKQITQGEGLKLSVPTDGQYHQVWRKLIEHLPAGSTRPTEFLPSPGHGKAGKAAPPSLADGLD